MLDLALKVGTELTIVLASNGDVSGDVNNVIWALCLFSPTIMTFVGVFCMTVGKATGPCRGHYTCWRWRPVWDGRFCQRMVEHQVLLCRLVSVFEYSPAFGNLQFKSELQKAWSNWVRYCKENEGIDWYSKFCMTKYGDPYWKSTLKCLIQIIHVRSDSKRIVSIFESLYHATDQSFAIF